MVMYKNSMMFEFLIFSYFGITVEEAEDFNNALMASIKRAYRDASSHVLSINDGEKDVLKKKGTEMICKAIKGLWDNEEAYDKFHFSLCKTLIELYSVEEIYKDKGRKFTYGIAQKWVNMTIKYIYMFNSVFNYSEFEKVIEKYESDFHIPLDRFIFMEFKKSEICVLDILGTESWSKYDDEVQTEFRNIKNTRYYKLQKQVQRDILKGQLPLEWEHKAWIENAKDINQKTEI